MFTGSDARAFMLCARTLDRPEYASRNLYIFESFFPRYFVDTLDIMAAKSDIQVGTGLALAF